MFLCVPLQWQLPGTSDFVNIPPECFAMAESCEHSICYCLLHMPVDMDTMAIHFN